ncbi:hypothetical protein J2S47_000362 [Streptomyces griseoviridis]|uniref:Uncharacterized protein n=1 Tax=Streptomyces griseoviridis TaxID=45398 RepID=A0ABT9L832_STRGD|nr:hypothetical protein [Streptomyces griseoviridis]
MPPARGPASNAVTPVPPPIRRGSGASGPPCAVVPTMADREPQDAVQAVQAVQEGRSGHARHRDRPTGGRGGAGRRLPGPGAPGQGAGPARAGRRPGRRGRHPAGVRRRLARPPGLPPGARHAAHPASEHRPPQDRRRRPGRPDLPLRPGGGGRRGPDGRTGRSGRTARDGPRPAADPAGTGQAASRPADGAAACPLRRPVADPDRRTRRPAARTPSRATPGAGRTGCATASASGPSPESPGVRDPGRTWLPGHRRGTRCAARKHRAGGQGRSAWQCVIDWSRRARDRCGRFWPIPTVT